MDDLFLGMIRQNVRTFINGLATHHDITGFKVLDVAPQKYLGAREFFNKAQVETIDIVDDWNPTYVDDICNSKLPDNSFDLIICTEVLEHVYNPFKATKEMHRLLNPNGKVAVSTPFNFRIHGPLPDYWRFTMWGLKELFLDFSNVEINELRCIERDLMPIHYTLTARKKAND